MASRQEEKARRRAERLAAEAAEKRAQRRSKVLRTVWTTVLGVALVGGLAVAFVAGVGGEERAGPDGGRFARTDLDVDLPPPETTDFEQAAKAAGCELAHPESEGQQHENRTFTATDYGTNPPTSGTHAPMPAEDGVYDPGDTPGLGALVHSLEHSRIHVQYGAGTPPETVKKLEALVAENGGYRMLLYENTTEMPFAVAATAWVQQLGCPQVNDRVFDALRTFRDRYIDKGPEQVP